MSQAMVSFKWVSNLVIAAFLMASLTAPVAQAAMVATPDVVGVAKAEEKRQVLQQLFEREDVMSQLESQGVSPEFAQARVASMTDEEVIAMSQDMDEMAAGGSLVGTAVFVFLVLLFTDIMGWTHIFPFVNHPNR